MLAMQQTIVIVASADQALAARVRAMLEEDDAFSFDAASSGVACLEKLRRANRAAPTIAVVDFALPDMSPLNLVGALTGEFPGIGVVFSATPLNEAVVNRAMLAGVRAVIDREQIEADLLPMLKRVAVSTSRVGVASSREQGAGQQGKVIGVLGAKGGAGRSTVATGLAIAGARAGHTVALLDLDLQFGDLAFMFDVTPRRTLTDLALELESGLGDLTPFGKQLMDGLTLYSPAPQPEQAEMVAPKTAVMLAKMRTQHSLVVVNTGAFWTLLHAELIDKSDVSVMVMTPQASSVRATIQARGLCSRLGIADAQMTFLANMCGAKDNVTLADIETALHSHDVACLPNGGREVSMLGDSGQMASLFESKSPFARALEAYGIQLFKRIGAKVASPGQVR